MDAIVDEKFTNDLDSASIFSKVIGQKLPEGSSYDLYSCCRMKFKNDVVQTQTPYLMDLGLPDINTLNESGVPGTSSTMLRSQRMDPIGVRRIMFLVKLQRS